MAARLSLLLLACLAGCSEPAAAPADAGAPDARADAAAQEPADSGPCDAGVDDGGGPADACTAPDAAPLPPDAGQPACLAGRFVLVGEVPNARDLGGTPLSGGNSVACGALYRGARLATLTSSGCQAFADLGIRTVIDLRVASEVSAAPDPDCVAQQAAAVRAPMPIPYDVSGADYVADLDATASVARAFQAFGDAAAYPIYFHCTYGRDRSGVLAAIVLSALGADREAILAEYQLTGQAGYATYPASLEAVLDEIEARGGIEAYLAAAGVTAEQLSTLRARATAD